MANAGNESDLKVVISVDTSQVRNGFEETLREADSFMKKMESILGGMDFSRVFDMSKSVMDSLKDAEVKVKDGVDRIVSGVEKKLSKTKELSLRIKAKLPSGTIVGTTVKGDEDFAKRTEKFFDMKKQAEELERAQKDSTAEAKAKRREEIQRKHNEAIREYVSLLEKIRSIETKMGIAQYRSDKYRDKEGRPTDASEAYAKEYALLADLRSELEAKLQASEAKYGGAKWFDSSERKKIAELSDQVAKSEAEAAIEARKMVDTKHEQEEAERRLVKAYASSLYVYRLALRLLRSMIGAVKGLISVSDELYQSQFKLAAAMKVNNQVTNSQIRGMYQYIQSLSEANGLALEVNYSAAQILASYVDTEDSLRELLSAYDDLVIKMKGYNVNGQQATTIAKQLARALAGDTNAVSKYGFVLSEAEKKALKSNVLSNAEKVDILVSAIKRKTGDLSKESETWAGMINRIKVQTTLIKSNLGMAFQNALYPMLKVVLGIAKGFEKISEGILEISRFVFGDNIKGAEELAGWLSDIDEELANIQSRLLSFDKFNVLSGDSSSVTAGSEGSSEGTSAPVESPDNEAWREWLELIGNVTGAAELLRVVVVGIGVALAGIVASVAALAAMTMAKKIKEMASSLKLLNGNLGITKNQLATLFVGVTLLISGVMMLVEGISQIGRWDELTGTEKAVAIIKTIAGAVMALGGIVLIAKVAIDRMGGSMDMVRLKMVLFAQQSNHLSGSVAALATTVSALVALTGGIMLFVSSFDDMDDLAKVLVPIIAGLTALAAAIIAISVASAGWLAAAKAAAIAGGIALGVGSMIASMNSAKSSATSGVSSYAGGGIPDKGQLFIANEAGPELVGNIGGRTAVANNDMIVRGIEEAAYRGFMRANQENGGQSMSLVLKGDAVRNDALVRALMPALKTEVKRQGGLKKAFGGD